MPYRISIENIRHYKSLIERTSDELERQRIQRLLNQEEAKLKEILQMPERKRTARV
jgi:hypothetical protein